MPFTNKLTRPETPKAFKVSPGRYSFVADETEEKTESSLVLQPSAPKRPCPSTRPTVPEIKVSKR